MAPGGAARLLLLAALTPPAATDPPPPKDFIHYPQHAIGDSSHPNGHCIEPPIQLKMKGCPADDWPNKCFEVASKDCLADDDCQAFALLQQHGGNYQTCKCSRSLRVFFRSLKQRLHSLALHRGAAARVGRAHGAAGDVHRRPEPGRGGRRP